MIGKQSEISLDDQTYCAERIKSKTQYFHRVTAKHITQGDIKIDIDTKDSQGQWLQI